MNNTGPIPPTIPPPMPLRPETSEPALGTAPEERIPIGGIVGAVEAILRGPRRVLFQLQNKEASSLLRAMFVITFVCSAVYEIIVGSFSGGQQLWAAPAKITGGLIISGLICLPSL